MNDDQKDDAAVIGDRLVLAVLLWIAVAYSWGLIS